MSTYIEKLFSIKDKNAVVTGGSRGIGAKIAQGFKKAGANVISLARSKKSIIKVSDFDTPEALAQYLHKVGNDETLYNSYFEWKKNFDPQDRKVVQFQEKLNSTAYKYTSICNMCDAVANGEPTQDYKTKDLISYSSV